MWISGYVHALKPYAIAVVMCGGCALVSPGSLQLGLATNNGLYYLAILVGGFLRLSLLLAGVPLGHGKSHLMQIDGLVCWY